MFFSEQEHRNQAMYCITVVNFRISWTTVVSSYWTTVVSSNWTTVVSSYVMLCDCKQCFELFIQQTLYLELEPFLTSRTAVTNFFIILTHHLEIFMTLLYYV